jgi:hypothetical protein
MFNIDSKEIIYNHGKHAKSLAQVNIPHDALADNKIFPGRVLYGYHGPITSDIAWGAYMSSLAEAIPEATGVYWCSGKKAEDIPILHFRTLITPSPQLRIHWRKILVWLLV